MPAPQQAAAPADVRAPRPGPAGGSRPFCLLHVTTVSQSLAFFRGQVGYMKARGVEFHALCSPDEQLVAFGARESVGVHGVEMRREITPVRDLGAVRGIVRAIRRVRPDVVHAHTPKGGLLGMIAARMAGVPVRIYHVRGLPFMTAAGRRRALLRWTERVSCALATRVLCVSHSVRDVAVAEGLCPPDKIRVLCGGSGNGVDATGRFDPARLDPDAGARKRWEYGIPADAVVAGFVGRVVRDKGVVELVEAWRSLREAVPRLHLLLVGPFEPQDPVPAGVRAAIEGDPRVHLAGLEGDMPASYAAMDLVVLPTYREGFPNVLLEAGAMARPVVATRIPGCVDAVEDGETGTLVPVRDAAALAAAMRAYAGDAALRARHGAAGRVRVLAEFRQEAIWAALHAEYLRLLDGAPARPPRG